MALRIFRVTVRGRFANLDDEQRTRLVDEAPAHDVVSNGAFTEEGTLTYEPTVDFFTFRFQLRSGADDAEAAVKADALDRATRLLAARGVGWRDIKVHARDMASVWD